MLKRKQRITLGLVVVLVLAGCTKQSPPTPNAVTWDNAQWGTATWQ